MQATSLLPAVGPCVGFNAVFTQIAEGSQAPASIASIASGLSSAIASWLAPVPVTINITQSLSTASLAASSAAAAATSGRRHLLQSTKTFQGTVTFTLTFTSETASRPDSATLSNDLSSAISEAVTPLSVVTTLVPVAAGTNHALNVSVAFPPDDIVSATPSQGTLAAVTFAKALKARAARALPELVAKDGPVTVSSVSILDVLAPAGPASKSHHRHL